MYKMDLALNNLQYTIEPNQTLLLSAYLRIVTGSTETFTTIGKSPVVQQ